MLYSALDTTAAAGSSSGRDSLKDRFTNGLLDMFRPDGTPGAGPSSAPHGTPDSSQLRPDLQQQCLLQQHKTAQAAGLPPPTAPAWAREGLTRSGGSDGALKRPQWVDPLSDPPVRHLIVTDSLLCLLCR